MRAATSPALRYPSRAVSWPPEASPYPRATSRPAFITETVFSHPSKLALVETALAAGYRVVLYHVHVRLADMSVARVAGRTVMGGHAVPEQKIRERYDRNPALIRQAAGLAHATLVFDNSKRGLPPRWLLTLEHGVVVVQTKSHIPDWAARLYL